MVSIKVVSEATGNPVHYSRVVIYSVGNYEKYANETGLARLESVSSGSYNAYVGSEEQGVSHKSGTTVIYA